MRFCFGSPPAAPPETGAIPGHPIRQPGRWTGSVLAASAGLLCMSVPVSVFILHSAFHPEGYPASTIEKPPIPWGGIVVVMILSVLAHELLHAVLHPDSGLSDSTVFFVQWTRLRFGVYYEGRIPRARWLAMRLLPMAVLTFLPVFFYFLVFPWMTFVLETYLVILILTNSLGSGGDLVAAAIVLRQVPPGGVLHFHRGRAYWEPAEGTTGTDRGYPGRRPTTINSGEPSSNGERS